MIFTRFVSPPPSISESKVAAHLSFSYESICSLKLPGLLRKKDFSNNYTYCGESA